MFVIFPESADVFRFTHMYGVVGDDHPTLDHGAEVLLVVLGGGDEGKGCHLSRGPVGKSPITPSLPVVGEREG